MSTPAPPKLASNGAYGLPTYVHALHGNVRVYVDGQGVRDVVAYDMEEGWVEVYAKDDRGNPQKYNGEFVTERHYGDVKAFIL